MRKTVLGLGICILLGAHGFAADFSGVEANESLTVTDLEKLVGGDVGIIRTPIINLPVLDLIASHTATVTSDGPLSAGKNVQIYETGPNFKPTASTGIYGNNVQKNDIKAADVVANPAKYAYTPVSPPAGTSQAAFTATVNTVAPKVIATSSTQSWAPFPVNSTNTSNCNTTTSSILKQSGAAPVKPAASVPGWRLW